MKTPNECECKTYCRVEILDVIGLLLHHPNCPEVKHIPRSQQREDFLKGLFKSLLDTLPAPTHDPVALNNWILARQVVLGDFREPVPNLEDWDRLNRTKLPGED